MDIKEAINEFISQYTTTPEKIYQTKDTFQVAFPYYTRSSIKQDHFTKAMVYNYLNKSFNHVCFENLEYTIEMNTSYIETGMPEHEPTQTYGTEYVNSVTVTGSFYSNCVEYPFKVLIEGIYIKIIVQDLDKEFVADEIAKYLGIYENKEFVLKLKEAQNVGI